MDVFYVAVFEEDKYQTCTDMYCIISYFCQAMFTVSRMVEIGMKRIAGVFLGLPTTAMDNYDSTPQ